MRLPHSQRKWQRNKKSSRFVQHTLNQKMEENKMDMTKINEIIWKETQQSAYEEQCFQHQEQPNEDYYECMNDYLDGTMNV